MSRPSYWDTADELIVPMTEPGAAKAFRLPYKVLSHTSMPS
jgi:hypothetical protein